jgi:hypothetical protein
MGNSSTNSTAKRVSGKPESKSTNFPGFKDIPLDPKEIKLMSDEELHRFYKLYGAYIVRDFYTHIGKITLPTKFQLGDFYKRNLVTTRLKDSAESCTKIKIWMDNMNLLNSIVYNRFMRERDENSQNTKEAEVPEGCDSD